MTTILMFFWDGVNDSLSVEHYVSSFEGNVGLTQYLVGQCGLKPYVGGETGVREYNAGISGQDG